MIAPGPDAADVEGPLRLSLPIVLAGGALGCAARLAVTGLLPGADGLLGVLVANVTGALALGILVERLAEHRLRRSGTWAFWGPGFLGAYTTFSALALLAVDRARDGATPAAIAYVVGSMALGLLAVRCGRILGARR